MSACLSGMLLVCSCGFAGSPVSWEDYKLIVSRNVFDPNRRAVSATVSRKATASPPVPAAPPAHVSLLGVFINAGDAVACLGSSRPEWTGTVQLKIGAELGPGMVERVDTSELALMIGDKRIVWPVGRQLTESGESWEVTGGVVRSAAASANSATRDSAATPGNADDILKRLRERRKRETQ